MAPIGDAAMYGALKGDTRAAIENSSDLRSLCATRWRLCR
jgi:hypothetical protein